MTQALMIIPVPINWEARVWEKRYNQAIGIIYQMMLNDLGKLVTLEAREIPKEDALRIWEEEARTKGLIFLDAPDRAKQLEALILDFFMKTGKDPLVAEHFGIQLQRTGYING